MIEHLGTEYTIDILDCKPNNVVDIVETDVEVDIDYGDTGKSKAVIPEVPASSGVQFTNVGETVDEEATLSPSKSLPVSKFRTKRNYFEGEGHSLKATKSEPARPSRPSGFRREESNSRSVATLPESRFTQKDKEEHFKGSGHKLC